MTEASLAMPTKKALAALPAGPLNPAIGELCFS
jgi:hypothetical protein